MIKAVIFDLWETLATKNVGISKTFFEHFAIQEEKRVLGDYEKATQLVAWESEEDMVRSLLLRFEIDSTDQNIIWTRDLFREGIKKAVLFPGTLELLQELKSRYKLGLISNTTVFESVALDNLSIRDLFDTISVSYETGYLKPSQKIFELTLKKLDVSAEETVFIDDGQKNVDAAVQIGMRGTRYENLDVLRKSLALLLQ